MKHLIYICLGLFIAAGCAKKSSPTTNTTPQPTTRDTSGLRVLCYNIHHANPPSRPGVIDMAAIAGVINAQKPDLVALQEVDVNTERSGPSLNQALDLAERTGMTAYFGKAIDYMGGGYGVAILSKHPMANMKTHSLPLADGTNGEPRVVATAEITLPGNRKIVFASTHLDAQKSDTNRLLQINKVLEVFAAEKLPVILAGDFNAVPSSEVISRLDAQFMRTCKTGCGFTIPVINPNKTIDYIAFKSMTDFRVQEHRVIREEYASDHRPVFSILELK